MLFPHLNYSLQNVMSALVLLNQRVVRCLGKCRISLKDNNCYRKKIKVLVLFTALKDVILTKFCLLLTAFFVFFQRCTRNKMRYSLILQKLFLFNGNCDMTMSLIVRTTEIVRCWFPFSVEGH